MAVLFCVTSSADVLAVVGAHRSAVLAGAEAMRRRAAFRDPRDGDDHVAARVLARLLLAAVEPQTRPGDWEVRQHCDDPRCRRAQEHGRPVSLLGGRSGPSLSWSHSSGLLAATVAPGPFFLGIDAEAANGSVAPPPCSWRSWVRAEAMVKAGFGDLDDLLPRPLDHPEGLLPVATEAGSGWLHDFPPTAGLPYGGVHGAIAIRTPEPVDVRLLPLSALPRG